MANPSNMMESESGDSPVTRAFVSGLPPSTTTEQLRSHFSTKFTVTDAHVVPDRRIGFLGFVDHASAQSAVKYFNRSFVKMSRIAVSLARPVELKRDASGQAAPVSLRRSGPKKDSQDYESKKRKREAHDDGEKSRQQSSHVDQEEADSKDTTNPSDAATREVLDSADDTQIQSSNAQMADSDWLRGKTSRLLDLVEEGDRNSDAPSIPAQQGTHETRDTFPAETTEDFTNHTTDDGVDEPTTISIPNARLFVRNLPFNASEDSVRAAFSPFGRISEVSQFALVKIALALA